MQKPDYSKSNGGFNGGGLEENLRPTAFGIKHQIIALKIAAALLSHAESRNLGRVLVAPCDIVFSREVMIQPDIAFVGKQRSGIIGETSVWGPPDLIVEILSRETRERDRITRRKMYSRFEVKEYWIVDPDLEILEVLLWSEWGYAVAGTYGKSGQLRSPTLPGFRLPLCRVLNGKP